MASRMEIREVVMALTRIFRMIEFRSDRMKVCIRFFTSEKKVTGALSMRTAFPKSCSMGRSHFTSTSIWARTGKNKRIGIYTRTAQRMPMAQYSRDSRCFLFTVI